MVGDFGATPAHVRYLGGDIEDVYKGHTCLRGYQLNLGWLKLLLAIRGFSFVDCLSMCKSSGLQQGHFDMHGSLHIYIYIYNIYVYMYEQMRTVNHSATERYTGFNVNPGLISPWLINRGCPLLVGIHHFWREHPPNNGTGLSILGQHYVGCMQNQMH